MYFCSLCFLIVIASCQNDNFEIEQSTNEIPKNAILNYQELVNSSYPTSDELSHLYGKITQTDFKTQNEELIRNFGTPAFNQSLVTRGDYSTLSIATPIYNENGVSAMLMYFKGEEHDELTLVPSYAMKAIIDGDLTPEDDLPIIAISQLHNLLMIRNAPLVESVNNYVREELLSDELVSGTRDYEIIVWWIVGVINEQGEFEETYREIESVHFVPCKPTFSPDGIGTWGTGGIVPGDIGFSGGGKPGIPDGTTGPSTTTDAWIVSADISDCVQNLLCNEVMQYLLNNVYVDPCGGRTASELYHDIILDLCNEKMPTGEDDFTIEEWEEHMANNQITIEDVTSVLQELNGLLTLEEFEDLGLNLEELCCDNLTVTTDNIYSDLEGYAVYQKTVCCETNGESMVIDCSYYDNGYTYQDGDWLEQYDFEIDGIILTIRCTSVNQETGEKWKCNSFMNETVTIEPCNCD